MNNTQSTEHAMEEFLDATDEEINFLDSTYASYNPNMARQSKPDLPAFLKHKPHIWFDLAELEFKTSHVTNDEVKFNSVLRVLDEETIDKIADVIRFPPIKDKYLSLKQIILQRTCDSRAKQIRKLLKEVSLEDKKPSQLLREMEELSNGAINNEILQELWMDCLPLQIKTLLISSGKHNLYDRANLADQILEQTDENYVMATSSSHTNITTTEITNIYKKIEEMQEALNTCINEIKDLKATKRKPTVFNSNAQNQRERNSNFCFYHEKFGTRAFRCIAPCQFNNSTQGNQSSC